MRTFDEINADIIAAMTISNAAALVKLAQEMQALGTATAKAVEWEARGTADALTGDYSAASELYLRAAAVHEELSDRAGLARVSGNMGVVYQKTGDHQLALEHYRRALTLFEGLGDRSNAAIVTGNIGNVCCSIGDFPAALELYHRARARHEELGDLADAARVTGNIGAVYQSSGDYPLALEYHRQALAIHEKLGDQLSSARVTGNMGNVYWSTGDYPVALEFYGRALAMHDELDDRAGIALVTGNMGSVYGKTGDYASALDHYRRALALYEELGDRNNVAYITSNVTAALMDSDQYDEASVMLNLQATMQLDDPSVQVRYATNLARLAEHKKDLNAANDHLQQALAIAATVGLRAEAAENHERLRDLAQKRNDFAGYIEHNTEYMRITEEVRGKEATQRMAMMEAERRIEAEMRERDKERALLYGALPESIATRMLRGESVSGDNYDHVSVIFMDVVGFTSLSDRLPPEQVVYLLEKIFSALDDVCVENGVTKIKTIGDSYMAVAGVPEPLSDHAQRAAACAVGMKRTINDLEITMPPEKGDTAWLKDVGKINVRIGVHCGPVTAGVIGKQRLQYDLWGDTVNVASRMESTSEPGRIHVSEDFARALTADPLTADSLTLFERGVVEIKGKGAMNTYWLEGA